MNHLVYVIFMLVKTTLCDELDFWAEELVKSPDGKPVSVRHHRLGRLYFRGYPKGAWGTKLFPLASPLLREAEENYPFRKCLDEAYIENESATKAYIIFREKIRSIFCQTNESYGSRCCSVANQKRLCSSPPGVVETIVQTLTDPVQGMPTIFLYLWCAKAWANYYEKENTNATALKEEIMRTCPNTCIGNPCKKLENTRNSEYCEVTGPFESQATGNYNCQVRFGNECSGKLGTDQYNCTCSYGYEPLLTISEDNCLARRDPCQNYFGIQSLNKHSLDFDRMLDVEKETEVTFKTVTSQKRSAFIIHRGLMCLNGGQCITSADLTRVTCLCPTSADGSPLYLGPNCEIPVGTWSAWSSMSSCIPRDCGHTRYRWRRRRCLNVTSSEALVGAGSVSRSETVEARAKYSPPVRCFGTSEEVIPCDPLDPCTILRLPGYLRSEILDYTTLYHFGFITLGYLLFSLSVWYVFATPILKAIQKRKNKQAASAITSD